MCQSTTLLSRMVWNILPQCSSQLRWWSILSSTNEWNPRKKPAGQKWNRLLGSVVTILKYQKITDYNAIHIKLFSDGTLSYLTASTDNVPNTDNNYKAFPELTIFFKGRFEMKSQEGSVLKHLNFRIHQSPLDFSVDQIDHIMELVNEWSPTGKFRNFDTPFRTYFTYQN